jgi:hypothetical protein
MEPLNVRFWSAFESLVEEVIEDRQLGCLYGFKAECGSREGRCDPDALSRAIRQQIGREGWPVEHPETLTDREIMNLVEFFEGVVVYPEPLLCSYCERYHITFGREAGDDFQSAVNSVFMKLELPFQITEHGVTQQRSAVLAREAEEIASLTNDNELATLIRNAVTDFQFGGEDRRVTGLHAIVDAFERTKALQDANKKRSIERLVREIAVYEPLIEPFELLFRRLTDIANENSIRHHEPSQQPLNDPALVEFLFYSYYNLIRFALTKLNSANGAT